MTALSVLFLVAAVGIVEVSWQIRRETWARLDDIELIESGYYWEAVRAVFA